MLTLTPDERVGEFWVVWGWWAGSRRLLGRSCGPVFFGSRLQWFGVDALTGQGFGILVLLALVCVSVWILRPVSDGFERKG